MDRSPAMRVLPAWKLSYDEKMKTLALVLGVSLMGMAAGPEAVPGRTAGVPSAPLRMDLWSDFTCPHCKMLHEQILSRLMADYVTPGKAYLDRKSVV